MKNRAAMILAFTLCLACAAEGGQDQWWPQFRGPNGAGVSEDAKPPVAFGPGSNQLWKTSVPPGASSPCIWQDRIFLTAFEGGKLQTLCYQRSDGKLLWKREAQVGVVTVVRAEVG